MESQIRTDLIDPDASDHAKGSASRATEILDANYEKSDLNKIVDNISTINLSEKRKLFKLLSKYKSLFDGTLGDFNCDPADLELKPGHNKPYHAKRAFAVPQIHRETLHTEING